MSKSLTNQRKIAAVELIGNQSGEAIRRAVLPLVARVLAACAAARAGAATPPASRAATPGGASPADDGLPLSPTPCNGFEAHEARP